MSGLRVYSTSVTGSREVSACRGPSAGERGRRDPPPGEGGAGAAELRGGLRGRLPPLASRPQRESLHRASRGLSSPSVSCPRPSSVTRTPILCTRFQATQTASLSCPSLSPRGPGKGGVVPYQPPPRPAQPPHRWAPGSTLPELDPTSLHSAFPRHGWWSPSHPIPPQACLILRSPSGQDRGTKAPSHTPCLPRVPFLHPKPS